MGKVPISTRVKCRLGFHDFDIEYPFTDTTRPALVCIWCRYLDVGRTKRKQEYKKMLDTIKADLLTRYGCDAETKSQIQEAGSLMMLEAIEMNLEFEAKKLAAKPLKDGEDFPGQWDNLDPAPVNIDGLPLPRCRHSAQSWYIDKIANRMGCDDCDAEKEHGDGQ